MMKLKSFIIGLLLNIYVAVFNSDAKEYGGKGIKNSEMQAEEMAYHNRSHSIRLTMPPLATIYLKHAAKD